MLLILVLKKKKTKYILIFFPKMIRILFNKKKKKKSTVEIGSKFILQFDKLRQQRAWQIDYFLYFKQRYTLADLNKDVQGSYCS